MGILNDSNNETIISAKLTRRGRELLAQGSDKFKIQYYAFGDDCIDYRLYDDTQQTGEEDSVLLTTPVMEPFTKENIALRYQLKTLPRGTQFLPFIQLQPSYIELNVNNIAEINILTNSGEGDEIIDERYKVVPADSNIIRVSTTVENMLSEEVLTGNQGTAGVQTISQVYSGEYPFNSKSKGFAISTNRFKVKVLKLYSNYITYTTYCYIFGLDSGAEETLKIKVLQKQPDISA